MAHFGHFSPMLLLHGEDPVEGITLGVIAEHMAKMAADDRQDLANRLAHALAGE